MARRTCTQEGRSWLSPIANYSSCLQLSQWQDLAAETRAAHVLSHNKHIQFVLETKSSLEYKNMLPLSVTAAKFNWWADRGKASSFALAGGLSAGHGQVCGSCCSDTSCCDGSEETLTKILKTNSPCTGVCCHRPMYSINPRCQMPCGSTDLWEPLQCMKTAGITDMLHKLTWRWGVFIGSSRIESRVIP